MKSLKEAQDKKIPICVVFNANTTEGVTMVRVLAEKGWRVVAVVRVFAGAKVKQLIRLQRVVVKVADWSDRKSIMKAAQGCTRAFLVTRYWERFDTPLEQTMATTILEAAAYVGVKTFVKTTFEDTMKLQKRGERSQIEPDPYGRIYPQFDGMQDYDQLARDFGINLSHMLTSYLNVEGARKTLVLIRNPKGRVIVKPWYKDYPARGDHLQYFVSKDTASTGAMSKAVVSIESTGKPLGYPMPCQRWGEGRRTDGEGRPCCRGRKCPWL